MSAATSSSSASPTSSFSERHRTYTGTIRFLLVNDVYTNFPDQHADGGWCSLATLLQQHRLPRHMPINDSIFCICGDMLGGSALSEHFKGEPVLAVVNELRADYLCLGNHEFDYGPTVLKHMMKRTHPKCKWITANVKDRDPQGKFDLAHGMNHTQNKFAVYDPHLTNPFYATNSMTGTPATASSSTATATSPAPHGAQLLSAEESPIFGECHPSHRRIIPLSESDESMRRNSATTPLSHDVHVGIFGVCTGDTPQLSYPGPTVHFGDAVDAAARCLDDLTTPSKEQPQTADLVVALTHCSLHEDKQIAKLKTKVKQSSRNAAEDESTAPGLPRRHSISLPEVASSSSSAAGPSGNLVGSRGIDVLLGGHDHEAIGFLFGETLIVKSGQNAIWLSIVDVGLQVDTYETLQADGSVTNFRRQFHRWFSWSFVSNHGIPCDPACVALVNDYQRKWNEQQRYTTEELDTVVAQFAWKDEKSKESAMSAIEDERKKAESSMALLSVFSTRTSLVRREESKMAQLIADAMHWHYSCQNPQGCQAAFINGGFIRGDKEYREGSKWTIRDIQFELPFPKVAVLIRIKGAHIIAALNQMLSRWPVVSGSFPTPCHTVHVKVDTASHATPNDPTLARRVLAVTIGGALVEPEQEYIVSITTFLYSGGDGIEAWTKGVKISTDALRVSDIVVQYLQTVQPIIEPTITKRIRFT